MTETNALGTTTTTYNLDSLVTSIQDADGRVRDFEYDNDQQLTAENWMQGSNIVATTAYGYDLAGDLTSASDPNSAYAFAYNGDAEVTSVDNAGTPNVPDVVLSSSYDAVGDRTGLAATIAGTADFANTYSYDDDQDLTVVQQQGVNGGNIVTPKEIDYGYNALGQFTSVVDYNYIGQGPREDVLTGAYSYDNGARLTGIAYTSNGGTDTIDTLGWGYDPANNVTSFSSIDGTATYSYDPTNQLTSASYATASGGHQPANESFSFDLNGNRNSTGYTTGSDNLMSSDGTYTYQHDADGNVITRTQIANTYSTQYQTTYTWDYRNRLTDVEFYDNNDVLTEHVHYVYDVFDHLIATEVDPTGGGTYTEIQHYVLDVSPEIPQAGVPGTALAQPDLVFDGNANLIQRNLVALDPAGVDAVLVQGTVASLTQGDSDIFVADDNLGTPRDDVNGIGTLVNHQVFSAFGQDVYDSNPSIVNWAGFAGGHADPNSGLVNDGNRWYSPATGNWQSQDPDGFAAGDTNLDRYVGNNAASFIDPTGLALLSPQQIAVQQAAAQHVSQERIQQFWNNAQAAAQRAADKTGARFEAVMAEIQKRINQAQQAAQERRGKRQAWIQRNIVQPLSQLYNKFAAQRERARAAAQKAEMEAAQQKLMIWLNIHMGSGGPPTSGGVGPSGGSGPLEQQ